MRQLQVYTYTIPAFGSLQLPAANDNFLVQASTGTLTVRGDTFGTLPNLVAGQGLKDVQFNRLELIDTSGAPNTVTLLLAPAEFVNQVFSGSVTIVGGVLTDAQLRASPVLVRDQMDAPSGTWNSSALWGAANSSVNIFTAAANVNGAIVWGAGANDQSASGAPQAFIAKATAPTTIVDGDVIAFTRNQILSGASLFYKELELMMPVRIAPGLGLYFISGFAGSAVGYRYVKYSFL